MIWLEHDVGMDVVCLRTEHLRRAVFTTGISRSNVEDLISACVNLLKEEAAIYAKEREALQQRAMDGISLEEFHSVTSSLRDAALGAETAVHQGR